MLLEESNLKFKVTFQRRLLQSKDYQMGWWADIK